MRLPVRLTVRRTMIAAAVVAPVIAAVGLTLAYQAAREAGLRAQCTANLRQLALAVRLYADGQGVFPPATIPGAPPPPERRLSWLVLVLPWTDCCQGIQFFFLPDHPWDCPENLRPRCRVGPVEGPMTEIPHAELVGLPGIRCPAGRAGSADRPDPSLSYVGIAGLGTDAPALPDGHPRAGVFGFDRRTRPGDVKDGMATTMMLAETAPASGPWTAGGPTTVRGLEPSRRPYIGRGRQFGGLHRGGMMVAFADGSVRFVSESIAPTVFEALSTIAGGEPLPEDW